MNLEFFLKIYTEIPNPTSFTNSSVRSYSKIQHKQPKERSYPMHDKSRTNLPKTVFLMAHIPQNEPIDHQNMSRNEIKFLKNKKRASLFFIKNCLQ